MPISGAGPNSIVHFKGLRSEFFRKMMAMDPSIIDTIAMRVSSKARHEDYGYLGDVPQLVEWNHGGRRISAISEARYNLVNQTWEATMAVDEEDYEDDQTQMLATRIRQLAVRAANHPVSLIVTALINGTSATLGLGYDGVSFFNDAHPARGEQTAVQDNLHAGTGVTAALLGADFAVNLARMKRFRDEANEPFTNVTGQVLIVAPVELEQAWVSVLFSQLFGGGDTNTFLAKRADLWVTPRLIDVNDWYMLNVGEEIKPLIFQERRPVRFRSKEAESDSSFFSKKFIYGIDARYTVGYGMWQMAIKVTN